MMRRRALCYKAGVTTIPYGYPVPNPVERLRLAWQSRAESDYRFDFWTAFGWTLLSCGIYQYYVVYQLTRRMRDHNRRRLEFLDAATTIAWERALASGRAEELTPRFTRLAGSLGVLRQMTTDFRDPAWWLVIVLLSSGIGTIILNILLDQDLVKHGHAEAAAEADIAAVYAELGTPFRYQLPPAIPKSPHQYALRVVALFATCGLYTYWWQYDIMVEGNRHFDRDWGWEDAFLPVTDVHETNG